MENAKLEQKGNDQGVEIHTATEKVRGKVNS
jgi:hypothetical protein